MSEVPGRADSGFVFGWSGAKYLKVLGGLIVGGFILGFLGVQIVLHVVRAAA